MPRERLQKVLARAGVASRRAAESLIAAGRVTVNGVVVDRLGATVDPTVDIVAVDGVPVGGAPRPTYLLLHKPRGYLSTARDERGRPTVLDLVPPEVTARVYPVGRLDRESEGLLLLTDDGELTHRLTHPRFGLEKEYLALVEGRPSGDALRRLREGVVIEGRRTAPASVAIAGDGPPREPGRTWLSVTLREGRKRQVRLMCAAVGHRVVRLIRVREGPLTLGDLPPGAVRPLSRDEVAALRSAVGLPSAGVSRSRRASYNRARVETGAAIREREAPPPRVIAIDGPGGAGKSSVGERVAKALGYRLIDTGLMYRALAWAALRRGIAPDDERSLGELAGAVVMEVRPPAPDSVEVHAVFVDGEDATPHLREPEVEGAVSLVSRAPKVREEMVRRQRELAALPPGVVMIGRDIGTVVVPDAGLKVYLDASPEVRARRRQRQLERRGRAIDRERVAAAIARRDVIDSTREVSPMRPAADAHVIDTDHLTLDEVVDRVMKLVQACR